MSSGADQSSRDMIEMPLYHGRNLYHLSSKSFCTSCGIFLTILCPDCQRITTAVSYMYYKRGYMAMNYLDDFGGAETKEKANGAYELLG
jgi:hypothetical protein